MILYIDFAYLYMLIIDIIIYLFISHSIYGTKRSNTYAIYYLSVKYNIYIISYVNQNSNYI